MVTNIIRWANSFSANAAMPVMANATSSCSAQMHHRHEGPRILSFFSSIISSMPSKCPSPLVPGHSRGPTPGPSFPPSPLVNNNLQGWYLNQLRNMRENKIFMNVEWTGESTDRTDRERNLCHGNCSLAWEVSWANNSYFGRGQCKALTAPSTGKDGGYHRVIRASVWHFHRRGWGFCWLWRPKMANFKVPHISPFKMWGFSRGAATKLCPRGGHPHIKVPIYPCGEGGGAWHWLLPSWQHGGTLHCLVVVLTLSEASRCVDCMASRSFQSVSPSIWSVLIKHDPFFSVVRSNTMSAGTRWFCKPSHT